MKKIQKFLILFIFLYSLLSGCIINTNNLVIDGGDIITIEVGEVYQLEINENSIFDNVVWMSSGEYAIIDDSGLVTGVSEGSVVISATSGNYSDDIIIKVIEAQKEIELVLSAKKYEIIIGESLTLDVTATPKTNEKIVYEIISGNELANINNGILVSEKTGVVMIVAKVGNSISNTIIIEINGSEEIIDPYESMTKEEFYANYKPADNYQDAYYRTLHGFMSGSIEEQNQKPSISEYQPQKDGVYFRNSAATYSSDGKTYYILDAYGKVTNQVYKGGAYVTLEEVAAYVLAFGEIPANYTEKKSGSPSKSIWGEYLRLNNTLFTGDTSRYPYEPELPNISGCGGELYYYEMDLGTTGTDCDPSYAPEIYNDGRTITRGAARIVYTRYDKNKDEIIDINEKYLFYTYNHYNDFQEYLNYEGGWGEMFGNITGGGTISSKTNYNPTRYVRTILKDFTRINVSTFSNYDSAQYYVFLEEKRKGIVI